MLRAGRHCHRVVRGLTWTKDAKGARGTKDEGSGTWPAEKQTEKRGGSWSGEVNDDSRFGEER